MPKFLYSSLECPNSMADRLEAHRVGVFSCTVLAVFGSLCISNAMSVREESRILAGGRGSSEGGLPIDLGNSGTWSSVPSQWDGHVSQRCIVGCTTAPDDLIEQAAEEQVVEVR
jgi:hypothetical protein